MKSSIIIPTYKEAENIQPLLEKIFSITPQSAVVVVDDNSKDGTAEIVETLKKKYKHLYLIQRTKKGRGSAILSGLSFAKEKIQSDYYIEMDADFSHDPVVLPDLLNACSSKKVVIVSRYLKGSKIEGWPISRRIASKIANLLIGISLGLNLHDNTNGYRCYSDEAVSILLKNNLKCKDYLTLSESAYLLKKNGFELIEIPCVFHDRKNGKSKTNTKQLIKSLIDLAVLVKKK